MSEPTSQSGKQSTFIAPSILSADFARLGEEVDAVTAAGADLIHFDVMDGHYVPNLTFGPAVCEALVKYGVTLPIDVHLMVEPVDEMITQFAKAGASYISFHPEASKHVHRSLALIRQLGCKAGIAMTPSTPLTELKYLLPDIDMILLMTVNPGYGGQAFIPQMMQKIADTRALIDDSGLPIRLEVDGGISPKNIQAVSAAGADTFVAGSAIFGAENYETVISAMKQLANDVN